MKFYRDKYNNIILQGVHIKSWQAKLCEAIVTETMKEDIVNACPKIQIGECQNQSL